jgi:hypothetical protein
MTTKKARRRNDCRLCGSADLTKVLALTATPPANAFVTAELLDLEQTVYPLDVWFCGACSHVQLLDIIDPEELFANYVYVSGTSGAFRQHFKDYADEVADLAELNADELVIDIGSNDGTLLDCFKGRGARVLGVDPARAIAADACARGIPTLTAFFGRELADTIVAEQGKAKCVTANNVFAHADDLGGIVAGVKTLLDDDGIYVFEVSYLLDVIENTLFDTIYHEHLAYHAITPLIDFFERYGLEIFDARRIDTHGGSIRGYVQHSAGPRTKSKRLSEIVLLEASARLDNKETYLAFGDQIAKQGTRLRKLIASVRADGRHLAGYGAPAKATTLMYHFGLTQTDIAYIVDDSPLKQGLYSPGLHIPIVDAGKLKTAPPDYLIILAWNFAPQIMEQLSWFTAQGGRFIVPAPTVVVH